MSKTFPNESLEYRAARNRLLEQEIDLRRATEAVAAARRSLPSGGLIKEDYVFGETGTDGSTRQVLMSQLFAPGKDTLVVYSFMYGPEMEQACPSCTSILDSLDGEITHIKQRVNLAVVAKTSLPRILDHARDRGWTRLRLLSSSTNTYNRDYYGETDEGHQVPMLNVFRKDNGSVHHFWGSELLHAPTDPDQDSRHVDSIWPLWSMLDITPEGRGSDWEPRLNYP